MREPLAGDEHCCRCGRELHAFNVTTEATEDADVVLLICKQCAEEAA